MLLDNKTAIIYGAGGAIGSAVARAYAREGADVHLAGRTEATLDTVARAHPKRRRHCSRSTRRRPRPCGGRGARERCRRCQRRHRRVLQRHLQRRRPRRTTARHGFRGLPAPRDQSRRRPGADLTAVAVARTLGPRVPRGIGYDLHVALITHGRTVCDARRPNCGPCVLRDLCAHGSGGDLGAR